MFSLECSVSILEIVHCCICEINEIREICANHHSRSIGLRTYVLNFHFLLHMHECISDSIALWHHEDHSICLHLICCALWTMALCCSYLMQCTIECLHWELSIIFHDRAMTFVWKLLYYLCESPLCMSCVNTFCGKTWWTLCGEYDIKMDLVINPCEHNYLVNVIFKVNLDHALSVFHVCEAPCLSFSCLLA